MIEKSDIVPIQLKAAAETKADPVVQEKLILKVKKGEVEVKVYAGVERYMFFHLTREWANDAR